MIPAVKHMRDNMDIQSTKAVSSVAATPAVAVKATTSQEAPVTTPAAPAVEAQKSISNAQLQQQQMAEVAAQLQKFMSSSDRNLEFSVDKATDTTVITVRDASTGDVIRQIPNEEALRIAQRLTEQSGTLIDRIA